MARGFGSASGATTGQLLMHELGHAAGLAHPLVNDPHEIMYSRLTAKPAAWGAGDLAGLRAVGASGGCRTPDPSHLALTSRVRFSAQLQVPGRTLVDLLIDHHM